MKYRIQWNREKALNEFKRWHQQYGVTPAGAIFRFRRGKLKLSKDEYSKAIRIYSAAKNYLGGSGEAGRLLGIRLFRTIKWDKRKALIEFKRWYGQYKLTPGEACSKYLAGKLNISHDEYRKALSIIEAIRRYVGGSGKAAKALGIKTIRIYRKRKRPTASQGAARARARDGSRIRQRVGG